MNYEKIYNDFINNRKLLNRNKKDEIYYENHHILPRSLGGNNKKSNMILLTAREHFFAHLLLVKFLKDEQKNKMIWALWQLSNFKKNKKFISSRQYEYIKNIFIERQKEKMKGINHPFYGKKLSEKSVKKRTETRRKNGNYIAWNKGEKNCFSDETIKKKKSYTKEQNSQFNTTWIHNELTLENKKIKKYDLDFWLNEGWIKWRKLDDNVKDKIRNSMKGKKPSKATIEGNIKYRSKEIIQYSLDGKFIKEWNSIKEATKQLKLTGISACCLGKQKRTGNYTFKYKNKIE